MKKVVFYLSLVLIAAGCSSESDLKATTDATEESATAAADTRLELMVEGMVCAHACGGSIKKALKETGAVEKVTINFNEENPKNSVTVLFDSKKISNAKIESIITELNEGQFKVEEVSMSKIGGDVSESSTSSSDVENTSVSAVSEGFQLPNLIEILSGLIL